MKLGLWSTIATWSCVLFALVPVETRRNVRQLEQQDDPFDIFQQQITTMVQKYRSQTAGRSQADMLTEAKVFLENITSTSPMVGMSVTVVHNNELVLSEGYGVADIEQPSTCVDGDTIFQIGSFTKSFIAFAIGILVNDGKVTWNDPVKKHIPWLQLHDKYMEQYLTIGDLLSMNSGFSPYQGDLTVFCGVDESSERAFTERLELLQPDGALRSGYAYANTNYLIAGQVIENVSGKKWDQFIHERITKPLGMDRTFASAKFASNLTNVAAGHLVCGDKTRGPWEISSHPKVNMVPSLSDGILAAGSIVSSGKDLSKFTQMLLNKGKLGNNTIVHSHIVTEMTTGKVHLDEMLTKNVALAGFQFIPDGDTLASGYGFDAVGHLLWDHRSYNKGGDTYVHQTRTGLFPQDKLAVVILSNAEGTGGKAKAPPADWIRSYLAGIFLDIPKEALDESLRFTTKAAEILSEQLAAANPIPGVLCGAEFFDGDVFPLPGSVDLIGSYSTSQSPEYYNELTISKDSNETLHLEYGMNSATLSFVGYQTTQAQNDTMLFHAITKFGPSLFVPVTTGNDTIDIFLLNMHFIRDL